VEVDESGRWDANGRGPEGMYRLETDASSKALFERLCCSRRGGGGGVPVLLRWRRLSEEGGEKRPA